MESDWQRHTPRTTWSPDAFTSLVYQEHISGKPRMSGARAALDYFGVPDADARVERVRAAQTGHGLAPHRGGRIHRLSRRAAIHHRRQGRQHQGRAAASSSKNAALFLRKIRLDLFAQEQGISSPSVRPGLSLLDFFDADVSGRDFAPRQAAP